MAKNHVRQGSQMTWVNNTAAAVTSGSPVLVGSLLTVALQDIAIGATGELATEEVWTLPKDNTVAVNQGDALYWDNTNKRLTTTATGNAYAGHAWAAAAAVDTTVQCKLGW